MKMNPIKRKRHIAFFSPEEDFSTNPSLSCIIGELLSLGADVDVFMASSQRCASLGYDLEIFPFPVRFRRWYGGVKKSLGNWEKVARGRRAYRRLRTKAYDLVFGINAEGVIAAADYCKGRDVPFVYLSYEMLFRDELLEKARIRLKREEIEASRCADLIIVQDPRRGYLLSKENNISKNEMYWLPVSPDMTVTNGGSDYLRKLYHIPKEKWIVLHSGSFEDWTYAEELLDSTRRWSDNAILVIHCKHKGLNNRYHERKSLKSVKGNNVIFSTTPLDVGAYEQMVSSADIGLCLYKEIPGDPFLQKNIRHVGLSSGKFAYYTKNGLPVISVQSKTYARLLDQYDFGENLRHFSEMPAAIGRIVEKYAVCSGEARRLFQERLAFDLYWPDLLEKISTLFR